MMASDIQIIPISNSRELNKFVNYPYTLHKDNPYWVPPVRMDQKVLLNPKKHPFYQHADTQFFLAVRSGKIVGRIAAIIDHLHNDTHQDNIGFFGFFEAVEDSAVADALLRAAKDWLKSKGKDAMRGPVNPCLNEDSGCLINGYDSTPLIMMPYNPPSYPKFFEGFGLKKEMDLVAWYIDDNNPPPQKLVRVAEAVREKHHIHIRPINMKDFQTDVNKIWKIYNAAWEKNWGFVPMTREEFDHLAKNLKPVAIPELALIAEIDGKPVGFTLSLPDMNQALNKINGRLFPFGLLKVMQAAKKIDMIRVITLGVIPDYQRLGIDAIFYIDTWNNAVKRGYHKAEMSWVLENNTMMNRSAKMLGGKSYKTYRMYQMNI